MNDIQPIVRNHDGKVTTMSLDVAAFVNRQHRHVMRRIRILIKRLPHLGGSNFALASYVDAQGKSRPCYEMDRKGNSILMMQFSGPEATAWHDKYTDAFEGMASEIYRVSTLHIEERTSLLEDKVERQSKVIEDLRAVHRPIDNEHITLDQVMTLIGHKNGPTKLRARVVGWWGQYLKREHSTLPSLREHKTVFEKDRVGIWIQVYMIERRARDWTREHSLSEDNVYDLFEKRQP